MRGNIIESAIHHSSQMFRGFLSTSEETAWENILKQKTIPSGGLSILAAVVMRITIIWDITPYSPRFGGIYCLHLQDRLISRVRNQRESRRHSELCLTRWFLARLIAQTLKMEATRSSEMSVNFQRTTRCYIPKDSSLRFLVYLITLFYL
jgi:hypothetical protein